MNDSEEQNFDERFASLELASRDLAASVGELNLTLKVVADLQRAQAEQAMRQEETDRELARTSAAAEQRDLRTRFAIRFTATGALIILAVVSTLLYVVLLQHVNSLLKDQRATSYANCRIRNQATSANIAREEALGQAESNPVLRKVHLDSVSGLRAGLVTCKKP